MTRVIHTVGFRLFVGLLFLLLATFGVYSYLTVRLYTHQMMAQVLEGANRVSDLIKSSTRYSMMLNRDEDVYQIMTTLGREPGVEGIRIYNKRGEITFSTVRSEIGTMVDLHAEACFACHEQRKPLSALPTKNRFRIYTGSHGHRVVGLINPIRNEKGCSQDGCHESPSERSVLGVLDVRMSMEKVDETMRRARYRLVLSAVGVLFLVALASAAFLFFAIRRPVRRLIEGTRQISSGHLEYRIPDDSDDEIGQLARSFNAMSASLQRSEAENRNWSQTLEVRVQEKTAELERVHGRIMHIEKMASLGKLAASVAHELNNPLAGILTYAKLVSRRLKRGALTPEQQTESAGDVDLIVRETDRCGNIVKNLLLFSRKGVGEFSVVSAHQVIERAAQLIAHHLQISRVQLETSCVPEDASFIGDENQVQQALVALMVNAVEAMPDGGTLRVDAAQAGRGAEVTVRVGDTGTGIAAEDLPHIFEPFFSTKKEGKGTGLGLSIVYGIMETHGGRIEVDSAPGRGTTFTLVFPPPDRAARGALAGVPVKAPEGEGKSS